MTVAKKVSKPDKPIKKPVPKTKAAVKKPVKAPTRVEEPEEKVEKIRFSPCSEKQRMILQDMETDILLCGGGAGGGKALRHGEKVLTPQGFKNIEEMQVGDEVITPNNTIEHVTGVYNQGVVDIYDVKFQDGTVIQTCGEHLWKLTGRKPDVKSTLELQKHLSKGKSAKIPLIKPLDDTNVDIEDKLTLLKAIIGDYGVIDSKGQLSYDTQLTFRAEWMAQSLRALGFTVRTTIRNAQWHLVIIGGDCKKLITDKVKARLLRKPQFYNKIVSIKKSCRDYATCISITGEGKLFITTNFVVTHNSHICLVKALSYITDPSARVLIVRESYPTLKLSGGLVDESQGIYSHFGGVFGIQSLTWTFPNGATIKFGAMPDRKEEWQGLQATNILVDEAASFTEDEIIFLISRLRGAKYKGVLNLTMTCNPDRNSFLYNWVEYCLDPETGIPIPGTEDKVRYFVNFGGSVIWGDSKPELWRKVLPLGMTKSNFKPLSFRFIPLTVYDNKILLKNNPQYLANLLGQPRVNQQKYLHG